MMIRYAKICLLCVLFITVSLTPAVVKAQPAQDSLKVNRLVALAELWSTVKYFHPKMAYEPIDLDSLILSVLPDVLASNDSKAYRMSVERFVEALDDPATAISPPPAYPAPPTGEMQPVIHWTADSVLVITLNSSTLNYFDFPGTRQQMFGLKEELAKAKGVLFDVRSEANLRMLDYYFRMVEMSDALTKTSLRTPGIRMRLHMGYAPQEGMSSGGYYTAFMTQDGQVTPASGSGIDVPIVFLINDTGELPSVAIALQNAGKAIIVSEGDATGASLVLTQGVDMGEGINVSVRTSESVYPDGTTGFAPDHVVEPSEGAGEDNLAYKTALELVNQFEQQPSKRKPVASAGEAIPEKKYEELYPDEAHRVLAAFKIWSIIDLFFPYKDLMDEDWREVFRTHLPSFIEAQDAQAYHLAVAKMYAKIDDTHGFIRSKILSEYLRGAPAPLYIRWVEDKPVVVSIMDSTAVGAVDVAAGDVILKIDGKNVADRVAELKPYMAASTPQALNYRLSGAFLAGPDSSTAVIEIQKASGEVKEIRLERSWSYQQGFTYRNDEVVRMLGDNIGYADLDRLNAPEVPAMFEQFKDTDAIIFDMRGYPNGTAWSIAPYLSAEPSVGAAFFERPMLVGPGDWGKQTYDFLQQIPAPTPQVFHYTGKTVMLIDGRTISQAEHTGLFFEAANDTKFIGSHTNGANGDVTNFPVPGGISLSFSGQSVKHADGRQLQRLGLVPHVEVHPTIEGIRAGKDEVLEAAINYLKSDVDAP